MYHFVGIKGSGMASLAVILNDLGYYVQGSDVEKHFFTEIGLNERNIKIFSYDENNIKSGFTIVKGASIREDNVELVKARELGLEILNYNKLVGRLTNMFKTISVCGCHGKTSTTCMLATALGNELKMNYLIGDGTGYAKKGNEFFALESCEYYRHFLEYNPYYTIITNIDLDHIDYFKDLDDVIDAYTTFANKTKKLVIACGDDPVTRNIKIEKDIVFYGLNEDNDIRAVNVIYDEFGTKFDVVINSNFCGHFELPLFGKHQLLNALSVVAIAYYENVDSKIVENNLYNFNGAKRRFNITEVKNSIIIDDYAHHPNEVKSTIDSVKQKYKDKEIIIVFQPHTYSRTREFAEDFVKIFKVADYSYVLEVFPSREKQENFPDVNSRLITDKLENSKIITLEDADILSKHKDAVFVFMSPNDISKLENQLKEIINRE